MTEWKVARYHHDIGVGDQVRPSPAWKGFDVGEGPWTVTGRYVSQGPEWASWQLAGTGIAVYDQSVADGEWEFRKKSNGPDLGQNQVLPPNE